jgi:hypothetical protein
MQEIEFLSNELNSNLDKAVTDYIYLELNYIKSIFHIKLYKIKNTINLKNL